MSVSSPSLEVTELSRTVESIVFDTPVFDIHTHLYPASFKTLSLWGIDELVNYHYLISETFRSAPITPEQFWAMSKVEQADIIWQTLFVRHTPVSEACRGVVKVMSSFGLDPNVPNLHEARKFFASRSADEHISDVMKRANVSDIVMTNDVFDPVESQLWLENTPVHEKYHAVLRMDPLLNDWPRAQTILTDRGYPAGAIIDQRTIESAKKFLDDWVTRMKPLYMAVSLPPSFGYPEDSSRARLLTEVVLPVCRSYNLPFSMMIGVRKQVNPALKDAGDSLGHAETAVVERLCRDFPQNKFLVSMLSRENQHELCVAARKFSNLMPFGCWWFLNDASIVTEITDERLELLGTSFIPQHSDARILDQLVYKWDHSRRWIADSLTRAYASLIRDGWKLTPGQIQHDVQRMFQGNFRQFAGLPAFQPIPEHEAR
jgi:hypothetical protein